MIRRGRHHGGRLRRVPGPTFKRGHRDRLGLLILGTFLLLSGCAVFSAGPSPSTEGLRVGVNYHAIGPDFFRDSFLSRYHEPEVRDVVKQQLRGMVEMGAKVVKTTLWVVMHPSTESLPRQWSWVIHFPPTPQEIANIAAYVQDVGETPLSLELAFTWLGCAGYVDAQLLSGTDDEVVEVPCGVRRTWGEFEQIIHATYDAVLTALAPITRPDGTKVVSLVHGEIEVNLASKPNQRLFLRRLWPYFASAARAVGLEPSFYFIVDAQEAGPNAQSLLDAIRFMLEHGISDIPARLDFSFYPMKAWKEPWNGKWLPTTQYRQITRVIIEDIQTRVFPLTGPRRLGLAETQYPVQARERLALGQAIAAEAARTCLIEQVLFWPQTISTWYLGSPPFDFASYAATETSFSCRPRSR